MRGRGRRGADDRRDPLDRFLANLRSSPGHHSSSSSSSSTPLTCSSSSRDHTLSDLPSLVTGDSDDQHSGSLSSGEVREREGRSSTPLRPTGGGGGRKGAIRRPQLTVGVTGAAVGSQKLPYHRKFPLQQAKAASPGEARAKSSGESPKGKKSDLSVSLAHSVGEVHPVLHEREMKDGKKAAARQPLAGSVAASSPGEIRVSLSRNKTRDGIDIIRISHHHHNTSSGSIQPEVNKPSSHSLDTTASLGPRSFPSSLSDSPSTQPQEEVTARRRLRVSSELRASHALTVSPAPPALSSGKEAVDESKDTHRRSLRDSEKDIVFGPDMAAKSEKEGVVTEQEGRGEVVMDPPAEEGVSPDATRPPPLESLISPSSDTPPPSLPPPPSPPSPSQAAPPQIKSGPSRGVTPSGPDGGLMPRSFWDTEPHHSPHYPPIPSETTRAGSSLSPGARTQLQISVPTGTTVSAGEDSPPISPDYSSDFDFSSISQPIFD